MLMSFLKCVAKFNRELSGGDDYKTAAGTVNARLENCLQILAVT